MQEQSLVQDVSALFDHILVDEYQDTNSLQAEILLALRPTGAGLCVVGDDAQSIYSFRGANFQNILEFPQRYPDARIFRLETNYRSTPEILDVANAAIHANVQQFAKLLAPARQTGPKPTTVVCNDAAEQIVGYGLSELVRQGVGKLFADPEAKYREILNFRG